MVELATLEKVGRKLMMTDAAITAVAVPDPTALRTHEPLADVLHRNGIVALGHGPESRSINLLRAQVRKRSASRAVNRIGVTSAEPDAGKSFVTANLAVALSQIDGQDVILLDLDFKRPTVARRLGMSCDAGLESWLSGDVENLTEVGQRFGQSRLSVYPAAGHHSRSGDLLSSARFAALVKGLGALPKSTIVLCDLPPAFVSDDAVTVVGMLDSYIHVLDEGITPKRQAEELRAMMEPAVCLGAVLNRYAGRWNDSYGYAAARKYARYYDTEQ